MILVHTHMHEDKRNSCFLSGPCKRNKWTKRGVSSESAHTFITERGSKRREKKQQELHCHKKHQKVVSELAKKRQHTFHWWDKDEDGRVRSESNYDEEWDKGMFGFCVRKSQKRGESRRVECRRLAWSEGENINGFYEERENEET